MSVSTNISEDGKTLTIGIQGRFDFHLHRQFREAYSKCTGNVNYVIDMKNAEYLDSSALGMLLVLREHAGGEESNITIKDCQPNVKKILDISKFDRLFRLQ